MTSQCGGGTEKKKGHGAKPGFGVSAAYAAAAISAALGQGKSPSMEQLPAYQTRRSGTTTKQGFRFVSAWR